METLDIAELELPSGMAAIVDTNVILDVWSCHDLFGKYDQRYAHFGARAIDDPDVIYRRTRARQSLLLATYLDSNRLKTFSLHSETVALLTRVAPPNEPWVETMFVKTVVYFVKDELLSHWELILSAKPDGFSAENADDALLELAVRHRLPLITNEGYGPGGINDVGLREKAKLAGARVCTPEEFYRGRLDEEEAAAAFLGRFDDLAPAYLARGSSEGVGPARRENLAIVRGYYRHILQGTIAGRGAIARVTMD